MKPHKILAIGGIILLFFSMILGIFFNQLSVFAGIAVVGIAALFMFKNNAEDEWGD